MTAIEGRAVPGAAAITTCSIEDARELAALYRPAARRLHRRAERHRLPRPTVPSPEERQDRRDRWLAQVGPHPGR